MRISGGKLTSISVRELILPVVRCGKYLTLRGSSKFFEAVTTEQASTERIKPFINPDAGRTQRND